MTFTGIVDEELADIWYALSGAEIRHPGCFSSLLQNCYDELLRRKGNNLPGFLEARFRKLRTSDVPDDVHATRRADRDLGCDEPHGL